MKILLVAAATLFVVLYSIKFAARQVDAKSSTGWILVCLVMQSALSGLAEHFVSSPFVQFLAAFAAGSLIYSLILDTTFKKGMVISLLSSAMIVIGFLVIAGMAGVSSKRVSEEQPPLQEMDQRATQSLARDPRYNLAASKAFWGDQSELYRCVPKRSPAEDFVIYLEILPDGSLGRTRFEPLTDVGVCFREVAKKRHFPTPPGTYVSKQSMKFKRA